MAIAPDAWAEWLDPRNHDVDQLRGLMAPPVDGSLDKYAVSKAVNNVKNNGPSCWNRSRPKADRLPMASARRSLLYALGQATAGPPYTAPAVPG